MPGSLLLAFFEKSCSCYSHTFLHAPSQGHLKKLSLMLTCMSAKIVASHHGFHSLHLLRSVPLLSIQESLPPLNMITLLVTQNSRNWRDLETLKFSFLDELVQFFQLLHFHTALRISVPDDVILVAGQEGMPRPGDKVPRASPQCYCLFITFRFPPSSFCWLYTPTISD